MDSGYLTMDSGSDSDSDAESSIGPTYPKVVVERAPNHDNTNPCFTAWELCVEASDDIPDVSAPGSAEQRPKLSVQMYDTTLEAGDDEHIRALVRRIYEETEDRIGNCRIDLYGLPMPVDTEGEERVTRCVAHQKAEIATRNATGRSDFFIPPTFGDQWDRGIIIVNKPERDWHDDYSSFICVDFDKLPKYRSPRPDPHWEHCGLNSLDEAVSSLRESRQWFYDCYVLEGIIDRDLENWSRHSNRALERRPAESTAS
ncbi:hypothetical protein F4819DRAFT_464778 [Hypoxylon fuscum]|nr:hypothetical protein F4819DRAFT_464778 [Hypoxylon fuscum]